MNGPLSLEQLRRAGQLINELERIESELQSILADGKVGASAAVSSGGKRKRRMSAAGRARIAAAARARWAKVKRAGGKQLGAGKRKRRMSAAARAKIAAAQRRRWAKHRAGK